MQAVLRSALATRVRRRVGLEGSSESTGAVVAAETNDLLDNAYRRLHSKLVLARGHEYVSQEATISLVAGTKLYDLPSDFFQARSVIVSAESSGVGGGLSGGAGPGDGGSTTATYYDMQNFEERERVALLNHHTPHVSELRYRITGTQYDGISEPLDQIEVLPIPIADATITLIYVPRLNLTESVGGDVYYNGVNGWEEWIVLDVAISLLAKEESDTTDLLRLKSEIDEMITKMGGKRDGARPPRVVDVRGQLNTQRGVGRRLPWRMV